MAGKARQVGKTVNGIGKHTKEIGVIISLVSMSMSAIEKISEYLPDKSDLIKVPKVCDSKHPLSLYQAKARLQASGLGFLEQCYDQKDAKIKYKDFREFDVVDSEPKEGEKVKPGHPVRLMYLSRECIDESIRLCAKNEKDKREFKERLKKRLKKN